jgi:hypothetical protein
MSEENFHVHALITQHSDKGLNGAGLRPRLWPNNEAWLNAVGPEQKVNLFALTPTRRPTPTPNGYCRLASELYETKTTEKGVSVFLWGLCDWRFWGNFGLVVSDGTGSAESFPG